MSIKPRVEKSAVLVAVFLAGIGLGILAWRFIKLPFSNPWEILSPLTLIKFNPMNNIARFALLLTLPVALLVLTYFLNLGGGKLNSICFENSTEEVPLERDERITGYKRGLLLSALILFAVIGAFSLQPGGDPKSFDTFHDGETLGPAVSYMAGEVPYKDFLIVHGMYEDPLRSVIPFKLFGHSVSSMKVFHSINKIVALIFLAVLLYMLFCGNFLYTFGSLLILMFLQGFNFRGFPGLMNVIILEFRDMTVFAFLIVLIFLYNYASRDNIKTWKFILVSFLFSFIPLGTFAYTVDRGLYVFAAYVILFIIIYFVFFFRRPRSKVFLISSAAGLASAFVVLGVLIRWAYGAFFVSTFLRMPRYKEMIDGIVYPIRTFVGASAVFLMAVISFWLAYRAVKTFHANNRKLGASAREFFSRYLLELGIWLVAIFCFRTALGRSDIVHVKSVCILPYMLIIYILVKHYLNPLLCRRARQVPVVKTITVCLVVVLILVLGGLGLQSAVARNAFSTGFPVHIKDSEFMPENWKSTVSFLKTNLEGGESFVTMTNEEAWYYFVDRPSPTRFPEAIVASPSFYQDEFARELENRNIKYVIYKNNSWFYNLDGIPNEERLPRVYDAIKRNYMFLMNIDDNEIWINTRYKPRDLSYSADIYHAGFQRPVDAHPQP